LQRTIVQRLKGIDVLLVLPRAVLEQVLKRQDGGIGNSKHCGGQEIEHDALLCGQVRA
jgi:hypothetical protein